MLAIARIMVPLAVTYEIEGVTVKLNRLLIFPLLVALLTSEEPIRASLFSLAVAVTWLSMLPLIEPFFRSNIFAVVALLSNDPLTLRLIDGSGLTLTLLIDEPTNRFFMTSEPLTLVMLCELPATPPRLMTLISHVPLATLVVAPFTPLLTRITLLFDVD